MRELRYEAGQRAARERDEAVVQAQAERVARELGDAVAAAVEECALFRLPICFDRVSADDEEVQQSIIAIAENASHFYVGGTMSVATRWMGRESRGGWMRGHCEAYDAMAVVAARRGAAGGRLEERCILAARARFPSTIANVANDSRGLCRYDVVNFIYVVWRS